MSVRRSPKQFISSHRRLIVVAVLFAALGSIFLIRSFAANPNLPGDVNNDNKVTITDLSILLTNYGKTYSGNPTPTPPTPPGPGPTPNPTPGANRPLPVKVLS